MKYTKKQNRYTYTCPEFTSLNLQNPSNLLKINFILQQESQLFFMPLFLFAAFQAS